MSLESTKMAQRADEAALRPAAHDQVDHVKESQSDLVVGLLKVVYGDRHVIIDATLKFMNGRPYKAQDKDRVKKTVQSCKAAFLQPDFFKGHVTILTQVELETLRVHIVETEVRLHTIMLFCFNNDTCIDTSDKVISTIVLKDATECMEGT